ncbi:MAG: thiamine pyrophosphate-dependent enzyme [bacterium]
MLKKRLLLGNEAIARGLIENGCSVATSYPGTPASEILASVAQWRAAAQGSVHVQWAINEKVAFEIAYAAAMAGRRAAVSMKQVGLNVASDPLMSSAYMGTKGGFIVIAADDPGPHSSQTEQDSRMMAMLARVPVLDPASPGQAKEMIALAYGLSEAFEIPVMVRPTTRVCHARQDVALKETVGSARPVSFDRDPRRWAATPGYRAVLHRRLEEKLTRIGAYRRTAPVRLNPRAKGDRAVVAAGVAAAHATEALKELGLWKELPLYQVLQPYPLHEAFVSHLLRSYADILVLEETSGVIEMQIADRGRVRGKLTRAVSRVGEILPGAVFETIGAFGGRRVESRVEPSPGGRRPTLCPGCPHRAAFFAIKRAAPKALYTSDIGCYTLGLNLGAVDTVLCMGAAIGQAEGFYQAFKHEKKRPDIVATIGDSTFFHAGIPALVDAVVQQVRLVLVILDNGTTAMTGNQPTPASGFGAGGEPLTCVSLEQVVRGCGVRFCRVGDPYKVKNFTALIREALRHGREQGPAVVIARRPCPLAGGRGGRSGGRAQAAVDEGCNGCGYCLEQFECPALSLRAGTDRVGVDRELCTGCGVCVEVCPKGHIRMDAGARRARAMDDPSQVLRNEA